MFCYFNFLKRCKLLVVGSWAMLFVISIIFAPSYMNSTRLSFEAPPGSPSFIADSLMAEVFPDNVRNVVLLVFLDTLNISSPATDLPEVKEFYQDLNVTLYSDFSNLISASLNYFSLVDDFKEIADELVSPNRTAMIAVYQLYGEDLESSFDMVKGVRSFIDDHSLAKFRGFYIDVVSQAGVFLDTRTSTISDLARIDSIILPFALVVCALFLKSFSLMIVPVVSVVLSITLTFAASLPIAVYVYKVASFTPSVQSTVIIAMSIDYSLFLLSRFKEERSKGKSVEESCYQMVSFSGEIILVSGTTLAITFGSLAFFPLEILKTIGVGAALALVIVISINVSLTPCLILLFPQFLGYKDKKPAVVSNIQSLSFGKPTGEQNTFWFRASRFCTSKWGSILVILLVTLLALPISVKVKDFDWTIDNSQFAPRHSRAARAIEKMGVEFTKGTVSPFNLAIINQNRTAEIFTTEYFDACQHFLSLFNTTFPSEFDNVISLCLVRGALIDFETASTLREFLPEYQMLADQLISDNSNAAMLSVRVSFDPFGDSAIEFIDDLRLLVEKTEEHYSFFDFALTSFACAQLDATRAILDDFPFIIGLTLLIVLLLFLFVFKSVLVPIRLLFTIILSISFVFGLGVMVYQEGTFLGELFSAFESQGKVIWILPIMAFSILVGLSLDYDCFLSLRIREYRLKGYSNRGCIILASTRTSSVITFAGIIMALAFSGLLLSDSPVLNIFGFVLSVCVLIDTFIVRTFLVPAITALFGKFIWFPGKVPTEVYSEYDVEEDNLLSH
ncbi:hypothetical protein P9112_012318 [Eukaryota sp. TZLM1-RC]